MTYSTREAWLVEFTERARPIFAERGYDIPENVRVSVGWPSTGSRGSRIGECWSDTCSEDGTFEIFISPLIGDASRIADIHTHELIHATVGLEAGHKKPFVDCMKAVGLIGKPTATTAGAEWHAWADEIVADLGPLPHASLAPTSNGQKKQTTRMIKCECTACGFVFRTSGKWLEGKEKLTCPDMACSADVTF